jgi:hypothetical protein
MMSSTMSLATRNKSSSRATTLGPGGWISPKLTTKKFIAKTQLLLLVLLGNTNTNTNDPRLDLPVAEDDPPLLNLLPTVWGLESEENKSNSNRNDKPPTGSQDNPTTELQNGSDVDEQNESRASEQQFEGGDSDKISEIGADLEGASDSESDEGALDQDGLEALEQFVNQSFLEMNQKLTQNLGNNVNIKGNAHSHNAHANTHNVHPNTYNVHPNVGNASSNAANAHKTQSKPPTPAKQGIGLGIGQGIGLGRRARRTRRGTESNAPKDSEWNKPCEYPET